MQLMKLSNEAVKNNNGSVLISTIVTMIILAVLGTAMLTLNSSTKFAQTAEALSSKTIYLAESGFRFVANEHSLGTNISSLMGPTPTANSGNPFTIPTEPGHAFELSMTPYVFAVSAVTATGSNSLTVKTGTKDVTYAYTADGCEPPDVSTWQQTGYLKLYNEPGFIEFTGITANDATNTITFALSSNVTAETDTQVFLCATFSNPVSVGTTSMTLTDNSGANWPQFNGFFRAYKDTYNLIDQRTFSYKQKIGNQLEGIEEVTNLTTGAKQALSSDIPAGYITLNPYLIIKSKGIVGNGDYFRTVSYALPVSIAGTNTGSGKIEETERFNVNGVKNHWKGDYKISDGVLSVTDYDIDDMFGGLGIAGLFFDQPMVLIDDFTDTNLLGEIWLAAGRFLSYDAQVKVKIDNNSDYYRFAGINFRTTFNSINGYGISFQRGQTYDGIEGDVLPKKGYSLITLWKWNGNNRNYIAYKKVGSNAISNGKYLRNWSSIMIRVTEAASLKVDMNNRTNLKNEALKDGDHVYFKNSSMNIDFTAIVKGDPIRQSGSWSGKDFKGVILLNNVTGDIPAYYDYFYLYKKGDPTEYIAAKYYRPKDSYIRVFFGYQWGSDLVGTADNYFNNKPKYRYTRGNLYRWAPDELKDWEKDCDFYTLVEFDGFEVEDSYATNSPRFIPSEDERGVRNAYNTILRLNEFPTPSTGDASQFAGRPEISLFAGSDTVKDTQFDDFAYLVGDPGSGDAGNVFYPAVRN